MIADTIPAPQQLKNAPCGKAPGSPVVAGPWTDAVPVQSAMVVDAMQRKLEQDVLLSFYRKPVTSRHKSAGRHIVQWLQRL
ncbi:MAG: hypothetical protein ABI395_10635 [Sphingobium sp.]